MRKCQKNLLSNITVIEGSAPEILKDLPAPDCIYQRSKRRLEDPGAYQEKSTGKSGIKCYFTGDIGADSGILQENIR